MFILNNVLLFDKYVTKDECTRNIVWNLLAKSCSQKILFLKKENLYQFNFFIDIIFCSKIGISGLFQCNMLYIFMMLIYLFYIGWCQHQCQAINSPLIHK